MLIIVKYVTLCDGILFFYRSLNLMFPNIHALICSNKSRKYAPASPNDNVPSLPALTIYMTHGSAVVVKGMANFVALSEGKVQALRKERNIPELTHEVPLLIKFDPTTQRYNIVERSAASTVQNIDILKQYHIPLRVPKKKPLSFWSQAICYQNRVSPEPDNNLSLTEEELLALFDRIVKRKTPLIDKNQIRFICDANLGEPSGAAVTARYRKLRDHFNANINIPYTDTDACQTAASLEFDCHVQGRVQLNNTLLQAFGLHIPPTAQASEHATPTPMI